MTVACLITSLQLTCFLKRIFIGYFVTQRHVTFIWIGQKVQSAALVLLQSLASVQEEALQIIL